MKKILALSIIAMIFVACESQDTITGPKDNTLNLFGTKSGDDFSVAINEDLTVWGWGSNHNGILGKSEEELTASNEPVRIWGLENVAELAAGSRHAVAIKENGLVYSWGANDKGQLGLGYVYNYNSSPSRVDIKESVRYITSGNDFNIAVTTSGKVYSWGNNAYNCQGHDQLLICHTPVLSLYLTDLKKIVINNYSCMAMDNNGNVWTWGNNTNNRLGREYEPFSGTGAKPAINERLGKVADIGFDRNFYVIGGNGKRTDIIEQGEPTM